MRLFVCICCIFMVAGLVRAIAQEVSEAEDMPAVEASAPLPSDWLPPGRVGQLSLVSGKVDLRVLRREYLD